MKRGIKLEPQQRFGQLTVLKREETDGHAVRWICLCDCGRLHSARGTRLRSGATTRCSACAARAGAATKAKRNAAMNAELARLRRASGKSSNGQKEFVWEATPSGVAEPAGRSTPQQKQKPAASNVTTLVFSETGQKMRIIGDHKKLAETHNPSDGSPDIYRATSKGFLVWVAAGRHVKELTPSEEAAWQREDSVAKMFAAIDADLAAEPDCNGEVVINNPMRALRESSPSPVPARDTEEAAGWDRCLIYPATGHKLRLVGPPGKEMVIAKDACDALGLGNPSKAVRDFDEDEKGGVTLGNTTYLAVTKPGLYHLALVSRKPEAKRFRRWVTHEVLDSIDKTGTYSLPGVQSQAEPEVPPESPNVLQAVVETLQAVVEGQRQQTALMQQMAANLGRPRLDFGPNGNS